MSDKFSPVPVDILLGWILGEYKSRKQIFGIPEERFFRPSVKDAFRMTKYSQLLETPFGVAAGPHTQMAQNIITAWLCGARYIELKTVQTMDELKISKPCIDMEDEGYNCEWSQELKLEQSFDEYIKAFIILHVLRDKFKFSSQEKRNGFIFNMSVGYNMEGLLKKNVQEFLKKCAGERNIKNVMLDKIKDIYPAAGKIDIPDSISNNITLSTMHGCPPEEIEKIGLYLINELNLHTTIKLNPTLLGYRKAKEILHTQLGFENIALEKDSFEHDLQYGDAIKIIKNLKTASEKNKLNLTVKLTNTLACLNNKNNFPKEEKNMYMSGRVLHPLGVNLAVQLQKVFKGDIELSFAGGADMFNVSDIVSCGIVPVTVCSDILKPGGYARIKQYAETLEKDMASCRAKSINDFILHRAGQRSKGASRQNLFSAIVKNTEIYSRKVPETGRYKKEKHPYAPIKIASRKLEFFDCINPPCVNTCPDNQGIPDYMYFVSGKLYDKALEVVETTNPFPNVTGAVCPHECETKCTRINYDDPLMIREMKKFIASKGKNAVKKSSRKNEKKVAVIGAGPSGLAAAYYLALENFKVTVFDSNEKAGGMLAQAIPDFRLSPSAASKDIKKILALGADFVPGMTLGNNLTLEGLRKKGFDYIFIAVGLTGWKKMGIPGGDAAGVINCYDFLYSLRVGDCKKYKPGRTALVIGGGNSAVDSARAALRAMSKGGKVKIIYRRTKELMPASVEEIKEMTDEGIPIIELTAQKKVIVKDGRVTGLECAKMELGPPDASGRARPVEIKGSEHVISCDSIIVAIGQECRKEYFEGSGIQLEENGLVKINEKTGETNIENVYAGGDVVRGASTIIEAIAAGRRAAGSITAKNGIKPAGYKEVKKRFGIRDYILKRTMRAERFSGKDMTKEAQRCLFCDRMCSICVTVCPNRANQYYEPSRVKYNLKKIVFTKDGTEIAAAQPFEVKQNVQVLNIADFCNECGNCAAFCPTGGKPYADKPRIYLNKTEFDGEKNNVFHPVFDGDSIKLESKIDGETQTLIMKKEDKELYYFENSAVKAVLSRSDFSLKKYEIKKPLPEGSAIVFDNAARMAVLINSIGKNFSFIFWKNFV